MEPEPDQEATSPPAASRATLAALAALLLVAILLRYPEDAHARGIDTFYIAGHAGSILERAHAGWILHPLSYFGLYPASVPAGGPVVFAAVADLGDMPVAAAVILTGLVLVGIGVLSAFLLGRAIGVGDLGSLALSGTFVVSARFLVLTSASASTRAFIMALAPVLLLLLIRLHRARRSRSIDLVVLLGLFLLLLAMHRSAILTLLLIPAYIAAVGLRRLSPRLVDRRIRLGLGGVYLAALGAMVYAQVRGLIPGPLLLESDYTAGAVFSGDSLAAIAGNMTIDYATSFGFAAVLVPVGFLVLLFRERPRFEGMFLLLSLACLGFVIGQGQYAILVVLPLLAVYAAVGLRSVASRFLLKSEVVAVLGLVIVGGTAASGAWMNERWSAAAGDVIWVDGELVSLATFLDLEAPRGFFISNDWSSASYKIWSLSGNPPLTWSLNPGIIEGVFLPGDLNVTFDPSGQGLFAISGALMERTDWVTVMTQDPMAPTAQQVLSRYDLWYFVEARGYANPSTTQVFIDGVHERQYNLYSNGRYSAWMLPRAW